MLNLEAIKARVKDLTPDFYANAGDIQACIAELERLRLEVTQREEMADELTERLFQSGIEVERLQELASHLKLEIQGSNNLLDAAVQERDKRIAELEKALAYYDPAIYVDPADSPSKRKRANDAASS